MELMELLDFLRARLDEDEQVARAAVAEGDPGRWEPHVDPVGEFVTVLGQFVRSSPVPPPTSELREGHWYQIAGWTEDEYDSPLAYTRYAHHIARHDPARVLREVEAKRAILGRHKPRGVQGGPPYRWTCTWCDHAPVKWEAYGTWPCPDLRDLASVYSDHPEYDEAWKP